MMIDIKKEQEEALKSLLADEDTPLEDLAEKFTLEYILPPLKVRTKDKRYYVGEKELDGEFPLFFGDGFVIADISKGVLKRFFSADISVVVQVSLDEAREGASLFHDDLMPEADKMVDLSREWLRQFKLLPQNIEELSREQLTVIGMTVLRYATALFPQDEWSDGKAYTAAYQREVKFFLLALDKGIIPWEIEIP